DAGSVTGRWAITDYSGTAAVPSDESPIFYHGNWPTRFPEVRYDYSSLSAMIKAATNNNASVTAAQEAAYREKMERVINVERAAMYAAVRGYVYDWDNFTINRGKNGFFYKPPGDSRFEFHHWDSDLAFQDANNVFLGSAGGIGWSNFSSRPWFRQKMNFYLSELVTRFTSNSPRTTAWLTAMNYQSANTNSLAAFKTNLYNYQTSWFAPRQTPAINFITSTDYNRAFTCSTVSGQTVATPVFSLTGACSSKIALVDIPSHPEAVFSRTPTAANLGLWTVSNIQLANGLNTLSIRALLGDGTVSATLPFTVTLSVNAPPVVSLVSDPSSGNVAAGETLSLDATGSVDPEGLALMYAWSVSPSTGVVLTEPEFGKATVRLTTPGNYTLTLQVTDAVSQTTTLTRQLSVYNAGDFASFGGGDPLGAGYTVSNIGNRSNFSPSAWYSLEDITGRLLINVMDDSAKPLAAPSFTHPLITRELPAAANFVLQTSLLPDTRQFGNWQAGLMVEMNEGGTTVRYALAVDGGLNLLVRRSPSPAAYTTLSTTAITGAGAVLRVVRNGDSLLFQRQAASVWTTVFTQALPAGSLAVNGGIFVATSVATHVRIGFDYLLIGDPTDVNNVLNNLRITELHYRPAAGGVEFIELKNTGTQSIDLTGVSFALGQPFSIAGVTPSAYTFGALSLAAGEYIVLTENTALFRGIYGNGPRLAPDWTSGNLSNSGEQITLLDASGNAIHDFSYGTAAPWPVAANGGGPSMEVINLNGDYSQGTNWRAGIAGGSPGVAGPGPDTDGDGVPDDAEALFGTNPANPGSVPAAALAAGGAGNMTLTWPSIAGVTYQVQSCTPLSGWVTVQTLVGAGTWTFTPTPGEVRRFYRVVAVGP
ncbi:MAG: hypothetical protein JWL81_3042, partial [Verrucomicrobiales bacterium]|nr:hypothetical protein [Verrucomicrobiales bacterium]